MIQDTSFEAIQQAKRHLGEKQSGVLEILSYMGMATNAEIAARLGWPINTVTPRVLELRQKGLVIDGGRRNCRITGRQSHCWQAKNPILPPAFEPKEKVETKTGLFAT